MYVPSNVLMHTVKSPWSSKVNFSESPMESTGVFVLNPAPGGPPPTALRTVPLNVCNA